ncbi:hypothetical protein AVEN_223307-1 [Araneus ventricosus]|uniref:Uncharacterized protein n=1 Tax=Araneus ventricosus TaxID=182803 RepID=A0A4Y2GBP9_ARAVE|nr:hypothetical protein AVEN_223307-1 [Araneus ventricosus]
MYHHYLLSDVGRAFEPSLPPICVWVEAYVDHAYLRHLVCSRAYVCIIASPFELGIGAFVASFPPIWCGSDICMHHYLRHEWVRTFMPSLHSRGHKNCVSP